MMEAEARVILLLDGTTHQGVWTDSRSRKRQGMDSPLEPPERTQPC